MLKTLISIVVFILMIGLIIFIHEFGHFLMARRNGVTVTEFAIGMGPNIVSWVRKGTKFSLKWIPFGGFCMMLGGDTFLAEETGSGEESDALQDEHAFPNKSVLQRISIVLAGPVFNFLLALVLAVLLTAMIGTTKTEIGAVTEGFPAEAAGVRAGDIITKVNHKRVHLFKELSLYIALHEGEPLELEIERGGETLTTVLTPEYSEEDARYYIGVVAAARTKDLNALEVFRYGFYEFGYNTGAVIKSLGLLFSGKAGINDLSGPVGMAGMVNDIVNEVSEDTRNEGFLTTAYWVLVNLISLASLISANLGIVNLLPIPAVDGGRLLFLVIEGVRGKPLNRKAEGVITIIGFAFVFLLMIVVLFNDIRKLILPG
ncbi:MAG: RIP metalloprotease RseP [Lachnospiraceae bacterium]|nr:RIP metalloprotease RseP [Lachnospiraceae bacterium]